VLAPYGQSFALELGEGTGRFKSALAAWGSREAAGKPTLCARMEGGLCVLSVDTSGELLHLRGYRREVGRAPLRETLAAGLLRLAGWKPGEALWDVMCGSGTILIEAAEQAAGLAPGRARRFAFEGFPSHDEAAWRALPRARPAIPTPLFGSDLNAGALGTARRNARRAGVALALERIDATKLWARPGPGLVIANLPYGKRVGEKSELASLYRGLGDAVRRLGPTWRYAFFLEEGAHHLRLPITRSIPVRNGGLRCQLVVGPLDG
jgi:putative N6-adenine-specific DNA methylase